MLAELGVPDSDACMFPAAGHAGVLPLDSGAYAGNHVAGFRD